MNSIGRFAPSPSGLLHFGSFITALGSYLHAKSTQGVWLVRIEDVDTLRVIPGAATQILNTLEKVGLHWDKEIVYQSHRLNYYREILDSLSRQHLTYYCDCSRQRIHHLTNYTYDNCCRNRNLPFNSVNPLAIRLKQTVIINQFVDQIRGTQIIAPNQMQEDFIIRRKDDIFAYNFAVVIDDHEQGINNIVRGADLLSVTAKQISLYQLFGWQIPNYYHLPLVLDLMQKKLSKQNYARPINLNNINQLIVQGLQFLGQTIPDDWQDGSKEQLLCWATANWNINNVPKQDKVIIN